jgi:hypothetical protein
MKELSNEQIEEMKDLYKKISKGKPSHSLILAPKSSIAVTMKSTLIENVDGFKLELPNKKLLNFKKGKFDTYEDWLLIIVGVPGRERPGQGLVNSALCTLGSGGTCISGMTLGHCNPFY